MAAVINILAPHVADMIAAGEVVERPASVIKELMENSIDAHAKSITVEIRGGGATYIRVTDDGCGMSPEDAGVAFLRHATSKLKDEHGLEAIGTMGFRGEALAAISAVSRIELTTKQRGAAEGTFVTLVGGDIEDMGAVGCPEGTTMTVRELFFNTPARQKFLKSDRSEAGVCVSTAMRVALGHPEISVRFIRDGKEEFFSPGDTRTESAIYTILGRDIANGMLPCGSEANGIRVTGFVSSPSAARGNRTMQFFYCNGRYIRSPLLQSALEQAYKNTLLPSRYPACVLMLDMSCAAVDVNVHPAKTEVKFSAEKAVFDLVYNAVRFALESEERFCAAPRPETKLPVTAPKEVAPAQKPDFFRSMDAKSFRDGGYTVKSYTAPKRSEPEAAPTKLSLHSPIVKREDEDLAPLTPKAPVFDAKSLAATGKTPPKAAPAVENSVQNVESHPVPEHKIVGEAFRTYIIVETGGQLVLIDKHAAHERMIFDRLKSQPQSIMAQLLLIPATLRPNAEDAELIEKKQSLFADLGFEIEPFGEGQYILRTAPSDIDAADAPAAIEELCEKLRRGVKPDPAAVRDELLHTVACKAAIKAGWDTSERELERVAEEVLSGRVKYCPHGRPVSVVITKKELEKMFKRIV